MDLSKMSGGSADFEITPEGVHNAVCVAVIDLGTQESSFQGVVSSKPKILLRWEIDEVMGDGRRFMIQQRYTASMHEKATLRKHLEAWRGLKFSDDDFKPGKFKLENLLGKGCQIQIVHNEKDGKTYANIAAVMKLAKGQKSLEPEYEPVLFDLDHYDAEAYAGLSEGMREVIAKSPEFQAIISPKPKGAAAKNGRQPGGMSEAKAIEHTEDLDDSIPF